jgi:lipopolysaccharide/colanic/teichoic acid biosynthesis glycosyltransferase
VDSVTVHESVKFPVRSRSILTRKRFQFATALVVGAVLPLAIRELMLGSHAFTATTINAFVANAMAVAIAFWLRLSIETYPGIRRSYVILPSTLTGHGIVVVWFLATRFPYDSLGLVTGFLLHVLWLYALYITTERRTVTRIAIVPFGSIERLFPIADVDWVRLRGPDLSETRGCESIVADFGSDLPDEWEAFLADAALAGKIVYQHKQLAESLTGCVELEHLSENSFGSLVPARGYFHLKSVADFLFAFAILPLVLPVMAVAAIATLLDDGRPVLFRQRRLGHAGRPFMAYKFRTMKMVDLPEDENHLRDSLATGDDDPRITRVGAVLRKFRIDELPQIFNILKGQMSWIGPRPEPEILTQWFAAELPFYRYRHVVRPGISGWAQVNQGYVSGLDGIRQKLQYDFYYIKYFSPWLDILIFLRTIKTMLTGFGSR